jgi:hypothetical protein
LIEIGPKGPYDQLFKTTEHRFWTMRIEAYYMLSLAKEPGSKLPLLCDGLRLGSEAFDID